MTRKAFFEGYAIKHGYTEAEKALKERDKLFAMSKEDLRELLEGGGYKQVNIITPFTDKVFLVAERAYFKDVVKVAEGLDFGTSDYEISDPNEIILKTKI